MILSVLNNERRSTVDRIVELTNLSGNKVRSAIEAMIELGLKEASGKGNNRTYILRKKFIGKTRKAFNMFVRRTFTKQDVAVLLKVTPSQAYTIIKKLQDEGRLELLCGGKYSKYRVVSF